MRASANASSSEIYVAAGGEFNINSNPQLREVLFERLKLPILKKTATGPSTDASVLQELAEAGHELPVAADGVSRALEAREHVHRCACRRS